VDRYRCDSQGKCTIEYLEETAFTIC